MRALTGRQSDVLHAIADMRRDSGCCPTVREIGERLGLRSTCTVHRHLEALERKGYLRRVPGKARHIELIGDWSDANSVRVLGGMLSSFRTGNRIQIQGARYPLGKALEDALPRDGHVIEFDLLRRLGMADEDNGRVRSGRLWFEPDAPVGEMQHE